MADKHTTGTGTAAETGTTLQASGNDTSASSKRPVSMIAVDMGASNIRIMSATLSETGLAIQEAHRFSNQIIQRDGHERWDMKSIMNGIAIGIRNALQIAETAPVSIGVDCWGVDFVLVDKNVKPLEDPIAYRDPRTEGMEERWLEYMDREETFRRSGINFYIFNSLFQLLSLKGDPRVQDASSILFMPSYVLTALGGNAFNELTIASTSQILGTETGEWDPKILAGLDLKATKFSRICEPGTTTGEFHYPGIELPGAKTVAVCAHDTASAVAAIPFEDADSVFISTGTWCIAGIESSVPILSKEALESGFTNERGYGGTFRVLKNIVGLWLVQGLIKSFGIPEDYTEIEQMADQYKGPGLLIDPGDQVFYNPEDMRSAFDGYFRKTGQSLPEEPAAYFRAAYDSLISSFRYHIEKLETMTGQRIKTIHMIGGGCQSRYLTQQTANMCKRRVVRGPVEGATLGNLLVQAIAMGQISGISAARDLIRALPEITELQPIPGTAAFLDNTYQNFLGLIKRG